MQRGLSPAPAQQQQQQQQSAAAVAASGSNGDQQQAGSGPAALRRLQEAVKELPVCKYSTAAGGAAGSAGRPSASEAPVSPGDVLLYCVKATGTGGLPALCRLLVLEVQPVEQPLSPRQRVR